jgi:N-acetylmuramic acid 6-phosphate etherase
VSNSSQNRSDEFLKIAGQFKLGGLVTEASHPVTANLSEVAKPDAAAALKLLFDVDDDVVRGYREFVESGRAGEIKDAVVAALGGGGRIFFTGCGATGRLGVLLDSVWRDFCQQEPALKEVENRAFSVMAGGDYALIKSVEGFEDFVAFGRQQLRDLGVRTNDVVFAITEGGETSFVIGTAWEAVDAGAKVYFVYNNPDDVLCRHVERSREVIEDPRIEKINLTTGPMAIAGSTRMQATSIQLCVLLTVLEMAVRDLLGLPSAEVPRQFLEKLAEMLADLKSPALLAQLARLVELEESACRHGHKTNYFADRFGIDVLTDTTERSPTYNTPPFRKSGDTAAAESWAFLFLPQPETSAAWRRLLKREPRCVEWSEDEVSGLAAAAPGGTAEDMAGRLRETVRKISRAELLRFRIGLDGLPERKPDRGDCAIAVVSGSEKDSWVKFQFQHLNAAHQAGARRGLIYFGREKSLSSARGFIARHDPDCASVFVTVPESDFLLDGLKRVAVKLVMNALSTCTMVRLGRVMGNCMVWVVPSNLKLIDRATRYIVQLTGLTYEAANSQLFEVLEYVEPRMKSDQAHPPVVGLAVLRAKHKLTNEQAEKQLIQISQPISGS